MTSSPRDGMPGELASAPSGPAAWVMRPRRLPPIWLVLAVCAVLTSLAVYVWPWLRPVLTASPPHRYPWWFVTALFVHVDRTAIPLYLHLVTNVAVIVVFGREAERRLGSARLGVLVASAVAAQLSASWVMGRFGDGTSGIAWALAPPALAGLVVHVRQRGVGVIRSARWWLVVVWRRRLFALDPPGQGRWDVLARVAALAIPLLIGGVLAAAAFDLVALRSPATVVISPTSGGVADLAASAGRVEVRFDVPMSRNVRTRTAVTTVLDAPLNLRSQWEDETTFVFHASRSPVAGESVRIEIDRLADAEGRPLTEAIRLTFD